MPGFLSRALKISLNPTPVMSLLLRSRCSTRPWDYRNLATSLADLSSMYFSLSITFADDLNCYRLAEIDILNQQTVLSIQDRRSAFPEAYDDDDSADGGDGAVDQNCVAIALPECGADPLPHFLGKISHHFLQPAPVIFACHIIHEPVYFIAYLFHFWTELAAAKAIRSCGLCIIYIKHMSYPFISNNGELNLCYLFMTELKRCFDEKLFPQTRCQEARDDFQECHTRQKHRAAFQEAYRAVINAPHLNVPHYDLQSDSFIFDDGRVISNTDPIFKEYTWY